MLKRLALPSLLCLVLVGPACGGTDETTDGNEALPSGGGSGGAAGQGHAGSSTGGGTTGGAAGKAGGSGSSGKAGASGAGAAGAGGKGGSGGAGASGGTGGKSGSGGAGQAGAGQAGASGSSGQAGASGASGGNQGGASGSGGGGAGNGGMSGGGQGGAPVCGDGVRSPGEMCEGADVNGLDCVKVLTDPTATGQVLCSASCMLDLSQCKPGGSGGTAGQAGSAGEGGASGGNQAGSGGEAGGGAGGSAGAPAACGDGVKNGAEDCDGTDLGGATCAMALSDPTATGVVACFSNCYFDTSGCSVPSLPKCGDGVINGGDQCDGADLGGATCATALNASNATGTVSCNVNCTINTSQCTTPPVDKCGDGIKGATEDCDGNDLGGQTCQTLLKDPKATGTLVCSANCTLNSVLCALPPAEFCGDGIRNQSEQCDTDDLGGATCALLTGNPGSTGALICLGTCVIDASNCSLPPGCGDGTKNGTEQCDGSDLGGATCATATKDSTATGTVSCNSNCTIDSSLCSIPPKPFCGDGIRNNSEQCDGVDLGGATCQLLLNDATAIGTVGCYANNCTFDQTQCSIPPKPFCGDNIKNNTEACDGPDLGGATCASLTGNATAVGTVTCDANCAFNTTQCSIPPKCGDGVINNGEQCDMTDLGGATCVSILKNSSATGTVSCNANCTLNSTQCSAPPPIACGDGIKNGTEQCDGADLGGATCATALNNANATGTLGCYANNCTFDVSACSTGSGGSGGSGGSSAVCGDGVKNGGEQCDGADLGGATCASVLLNASATGTLSCFGNCTLNSSGCSLGSGGSGGSSGSGGSGGSAGAPTCIIKKCQNHIYQCGDCIDNDGDGKIDDHDSDCLNNCDNSEKGLDLNIPGGNSAPCKADCYFDQDTGSGNDNCQWDHHCDPNEKSPTWYPETESGNQCKYDPNYKIAAGLTCSQAQATQSSTCMGFCGPLTPNGCDCFGCCDIGGVGNYVWLGSKDANGVPSCTVATAGDPTKCHPCQPVGACLNTCAKCELCLGKETLPAECLPPPCGDGIKNGSEQCDKTDLGGATCQSVLGNANATGTLGCYGNCTLNASACVVPPPIACGDGIKNGTEQCDKSDLGGATCQSVTGNPSATGSLSCNANCTLNSGGCSVPTSPICGDGVKNGSEQCDKTDLGGATCASLTGNASATGTLACNANCTLDGTLCTVPPGCGDGVKNGTEQCDKTDLGGATCSSVLGNPNATGTLSCNANCTFNSNNCTAPAPVCGDGVKNGSEQCDGSSLGGATCQSVLGNANATGTLSCNANCTLNSSGCSVPVIKCGDGVKNGTEQCDGVDLGGATCASVTGDPSATGSLSCLGNCTLDTSGCVVTSCGGQICPPGEQACGLPCQAPCPADQFCLTGCCVPLIK